MHTYALLLTALAILCGGVATAGTYQIDITKAPYNAVGDGAADCTDAINHALADAAKASPKATVRVPAGAFAHSGQIYIDGVTLSGAGIASVIRSTKPNSSAINLRGDGASIENLEIDCPTAATRLSSGWQTGITVAATNFRVRGICIGNKTTMGSPSAGILCLDASHGLISGNTIWRSLADGIHMTGGSNNILVEKNTILGAGDDMIAVVSYLGNASKCHDITIRNNNCLGQTGGRGITVIGGDNVLIQNNQVENSFAAGIHAASESSYMTYGPTNVTIEGNTLKNCDTRQFDSHGSIFVYGNILTYKGQTTDQTAQNIVIRGNKIIDSHCAAIRIGSYVHGAIVENNTIDGAEYDGIGISLWPDPQPGSGSKDIVVRGNTISRTGRTGIVACNGTQGSLTIVKNTISDIGHSKGSFGAILIDSGASAINPLEIMDNAFKKPAGPSASRFVDCRISAGASGASAAEIQKTNVNKTDKPSVIAP